MSKPKHLYSKTYTDYFVNKVTKSNKKILTHYIYIHYSQTGDDNMAENEITLKVAEAISQKDVGQGVARLDPNVMADLKIRERDLIEIVGHRQT